MVRLFEIKPSWEVFGWEQARESPTADCEDSDGSDTSLLVVGYSSQVAYMRSHSGLLELGEYSREQHAPLLLLEKTGVFQGHTVNQPGAGVATLLPWPLPCPSAQYTVDSW